MDSISEKYLSPTAIIDSDHPKIIQFAIDTVRGSDPDAVSKAIKLYYAVRDGIWYDPYSGFYLPEHYRASRVLEKGRGYCVSKASLLCALARVCHIPARIGFADVRNHLATRQLIELMGSDLFVFHGFTEFYLEGKWVKATPAFNVELCEKHRVEPLEFNGRDDSIFQPFNSEKKKFMEYVKDHGAFADIPLDRIVAAWEKAYGRDRVREWTRLHENAGQKSFRDFTKEDIL